MTVICALNKRFAMNIKLCLFQTRAFRLITEVPLLRPDQCFTSYCLLDLS